MPYLYEKGELAMKYRLSIFNIGGGLLILFNLALILIRNLYDSQITIFTTLLPILSFFVALVSLHIDFFLQFAIKDRKWLNITEGILVLVTLTYFILTT